MNLLGLLSGTSMDGLDVGWVQLRQGRPRLQAFHTLPWPEPLARRWRQALEGEPLDPPALARLDRETALAFARAVHTSLQRWNLPPQTVDAIGFHGQTLAHGGQQQPAWTLQLGHAPTLAAETGITVVAGFRQDDIAHGGQGAPLAPLLHRALLEPVEEACAVLNLGGIANLSILLPDRTLGLDTGPGNCLLDTWYRRHHPHDADGWDEAGRWAASGRVMPRLLQALLDDPWFERPAPRSACRQDFSLAWLESHLLRHLQGQERPADIQATLVELTARSVARALTRLGPDCQHLWVAGGGVHNQTLMHSLRQALPGVTIQPASLAGMDADGLEAQLFAWLATCRLQRRPLDLSGITGARGPRLLGQVHRPPAYRPD